jgi:hypothetical protein
LRYLAAFDLTCRLHRRAEQPENTGNPNKTRVFTTTRVSCADSKGLEGMKRLQKSQNPYPLMNQTPKGCGTQIQSLIPRLRHPPSKDRNIEGSNIFLLDLSQQLP